MYRSPYGRRCIEVLLIEDNPADIRLIQEGLKREITLRRLHVVTDGQEAVDFIRKAGKHSGAPAPDLILLDLNLPKIAGLQVLAEIKRNADTKRIPVIVLTTSKAACDVERAYELEANCYVQKPSDLDGLLAMLGALEAFWLGWAVLPAPVVRTRPGEQSRVAVGS